MPPDRGCFTRVNLPQSFTLPQCMDYFSIAAGPNTDLWRKPPDRDTTTAPILYTSLRQPFVVAEVTVSADWELEWDQGGLVIFAGAPPRDNPQRANSDSTSEPVSSGEVRIQIQDSNNPSRTTQPPPYPHPLPGAGSKWVKAGLEFSAGTVNAASVSATSDGADWCLSPLLPPHTPSTHPNAITSLRIKLERIGHSLWVWYQVPSLVNSVPPAYGMAGGSEIAAPSVDEVASSWRKMREVTWFFWGVEDKHVHVGVYASRPANFAASDTVWAAREGRRFVRSDPEAGKLVVDFEDLEIF